MRNSFVGLDIGYDSIKVIELKRDKAGLVATNCVIEPIEYDDVKNYSEEKVAEAIARALKNPSIKGSSVVVSLSGQSVFTRFIKFPTLDRSKIDQIVQFEAQQQVPFPIDDVIWDYQLLGDWATIDDIDEASVALVASKKEVITGLLENFESLKMDIEYIDIAPFALCNCIKFNEPALDGCTLVLDIGAKSTDMLVMEKDTVWLRNIPIGGIAMTQAVQKEFKVTFKEAEFLKKKYSVILCGDGPMVGESPERLRISRALTATMTRLLAEISRSIGYYRSHSDGGRIKQIVLVGGGSNIENIGTFLEHKFNVGVKKLDTMHNLEYRNGIAEFIAKEKHVLGCAIGLALRKATDCVMEINLLPKQLATQREIKKKKSYILGCFVLVGIMMASGIGFFKQWVKYETNVSSGLYEDLKRLKSHSTKINDAKKHVTVYKQKLDDLLKLQQQRTYWARLTTELQTVLPENAWLKRFSVHKSRTKDVLYAVRIFGETTAPLGEIPFIKERMEKSPFFKNVSIKSADDLSSVSIGGKDIRRFEIVGELLQN